MGEGRVKTPRQLLLAGILSIALVSASCGEGSDDASGQGQQSITVGWYGGPIGKAFKQVVVAPFEKKTNIQVKVETAFDDARLTKLHAQPGSLDVAFFTDPVMPQVRSAGIADELDASDIPNLSDVYPNLKSKDSFAWTFGVWGLAYNADKVKPAPKSWSDLLDPRLKGHVTEPDITYNSSILSLVAFARLGGGDLGNLAPGFQRMKRLRGLSPFFWASSSQMLQQLQSGSIWVTPYASGGTYEAAKAAGAPPIKFATPEEGGYLVKFNTVIPKDSRNKTPAAKFANFMLTPKVQAKWAQKIYYAPANSKTELPSDVKDMIVSGSEVTQLQDINWQKFAAMRDTVVKKWQSQIS